MALGDRNVINTPTLAGAAIVACHPPTQPAVHNKVGQIYYRQDETTRVTAPRLAASDGTAGPRGDRRVIAACNESAANRGIGNVGKGAVINISGRYLQHPAVKAALQIEVVPEP